MSKTGIKNIDNRIFSPKIEFDQKHKVSKKKYTQYADSLGNAHTCYNAKTSKLGQFHSEAQRASEMELANIILR